tara:strand:- start:284 stop:469 length:186 start_codon:yes stop_codon:yes gene_type:complete
MEKAKEYKKEAKKLESPEIKEVIESLKTQLEQHQKQSKYHSDMALKAQGAIEVLAQLESEE